MISLNSIIVQKLLNYFFLNPDDGLYVNELVRKLNLDKRNLVKKLKLLENEKLLISEKKGNLKIYSINKEYALYEEYKKIVFKTVGLEARIKGCLMGVDSVNQAYIYGSYASNTMDSHSDIDLLIVGEHSVLSVQRKISRLQKEIDREINVVNMGNKEFNRRLKNKDSFLLNVFNGKNIQLI